MDFSHPECITAFYQEEKKETEEGWTVEEKGGKGREGRRGHLEAIKHILNSDLSHKGNKHKIFF